MFCSKCGKEIEEESEFCKHCGAQVGLGGEHPKAQDESSEEIKDSESEEPGEIKEEEFGEPKPEEQPKETKAPLEKKKPKRKLAVFLIVIGIIMVSVLIWYIIAYEKADEHVYYTYAPETAPSSLTFEVEMNGGETDINFTSNPSDPVVYIDHYKRWEGAVVSQPSFSSSSTKVSFDSGTVWGESDSALTITLRSDVKYTIDIKTSNGALNFDSNIPGISFGSFTIDTLNGASNMFINHATILGKIRVTTESGSANFFLTNCTAHDVDSSAKSGSSNIFLTNCTVGNIKSTSYSGSLSISSQDLRVVSDSTWTLKAERGGVGMNIIQRTSLGGDVTVNANIEGRGDITSSFEGNATFVRAKFTASASGGSATLANGGGFNAPVSGAMESSNYGNEALDKFLLDLSTSNGNIGVDAENT